MNRIKELRKNKGLTQQQLADYLGIDRTSIGKYENNGVQPSNEILFKMADYFEVSVDYLLGHDVKSPDLATFFESNATLVKDARMIPVVSKVITACCGEGSHYASEVEWEVIGAYPFEESKLMGYAWQTPSFFIIRVTGESMEPIIYDGERILFGESVELLSGDIALLQWDGRLLIRAVIFEKDGKITLRATKNGYPDITVDGYDERLCLLGKVLHKIPDPEPVHNIWS